MSTAKKMCFDRVLPGDLRRQHRVIPYGRNRARAISVIGKQWINGSTIRVRFLSGTQNQIAMVKSIAPEWCNHANLKLEFGTDPRAEIRVTFDAADGAWSYVGTDNLTIPLHAATLNLGWQDEGVILHEFGHMIGLSHEHQNPDGGIVWNEAEVIRDLSGPPNFWDEATIRHNVLEKYAADQIHGTDFDPESIMLYAFPAAWTVGGVATHENQKLSALDQAFVASEEMYPRAATVGGAVELPVTEAVVGSIGVAGEIDLYSFVAPAAGIYTVQTLGVTDLVATLFGPNSQTTMVAQDDDSGGGRNAQISAELEAGKYFVQVRHFSDQDHGDYRILVSRAGTNGGQSVHA